MFNLNTEAARSLQKAIADGKLGDAKAVFEDPSSKGVDETPEMRLLTATEAIRRDVANMGAWFTGPKANIVDAISRLTGAMAGEKMFEYSKESTPEALESIGLYGDEKKRVERLYQEAHTKKGQPDANDNLLGDWGEYAGETREMMAALPLDIKYQISQNPRMQRALFSQFQRVEDFTPENVAAFKKALEDITPLHGITSDGVTNADVQKKIRDTAQRRTDNEINDQYMLPREVPRISSDLMWPDALKSQEHQDFTDIMKAGHPEIGYKELQDIIAPYTKRESDKGGMISQAELGKIVQALRDLVPALEEANTIVIEQREN
jgi:hypothetical protein